MDHYKGLIKIVYKDYPFPGHPWARRAAVDANCLASQSDTAYWAYVDYVHSMPGTSAVHSLTRPNHLSP